MKKVSPNLLFVLFLFISQSIVSQHYQNRQYQSLLNQLYVNQKYYSPGMQSTIETVNGFDNFRLGTDFAEPMIAVNPRDPLNSICAFVFNKVYLTLDGINWAYINVSPSVSADPFLCYDSLGNAYYISFVSNPYRLIVSKSTNKGINWNSYTLYNGSLDKPSIIAVQSGGPFSNFLYATWNWPQSDTTENIYLNRSTNGGVNWSSPIRVNVTYLGYCPWMAIGPNGSVPGGYLYCAYNGGNNPDSIQVLIRRSSDGGVSFQNEIVAATLMHAGDPNCSYWFIKNCKVQDNDFIQMVADNSFGPNRGNIYIVYCARGYSDFADIFFVRSSNYGTNWSIPIKLNDDNTSTDQWMPAISIDNGTGRIFVSWYDSRIDPGSNLQTKLFGTVSSDGGNSFSPNSPISTVSFNPQNIVQNFGGPGYMGHYNGISAIGHSSYIAWTDGRNNNFGSYVAYYPDFAMTINPDTLVLRSDDSGTAIIKIPGVNGPFNDHIRFNAVLDTIAPSGNINFNFIGRDSISAIPDSIALNIRTTGVTFTGSRRISVTGYNTFNAVPRHLRTIYLSINPIGIKIVSIQIPKEYRLYQNYPNPFNPTTKIKFDIPSNVSPHFHGDETSDVKLVIYDILGRGVTTLVNERLHTGSYEVEWDALNYASGVYFYKLEAEDFISVKKLVILK